MNAANGELTEIDAAQTLEGFRRATGVLSDVSFDTISGAGPNGAMNEIAGLYAPNLRVLGMMPHPENLIDPLVGGTDGLPLFESLADTLDALAS